MENTMHSKDRQMLWWRVNRNYVIVTWAQYPSFISIPHPWTRSFWENENDELSKLWIILIYYRSQYKNNIKFKGDKIKLHMKINLNKIQMNAS